MFVRRYFVSAPEAAKTAAGGIGPWVPWIAGVLVAGLVGGGIGLSGIAGHETQNVVEFGSVGVSKTTPGYSCPGGGAITTLDRGERVLALSRNDDASWVSVRDPRSLGTTVWVPVGLVVVDDGQGTVTDLPLGDPCPTISLPPGLVEDAPPAAPDAPAPAAPAAPAAPDTSAPTITSASATPDHLLCGVSSTLSVNATDNTGVASVKVTLSAPDAQTHALTQSGSTWQWNYTPSSSYYQNGTATFTATDAAGNVSAPVTITIYYTCLI